MTDFVADSQLSKYLEYGNTVASYITLQKGKSYISIYRYLLCEPHFHESQRIEFHRNSRLYYLISLSKLISR